MDKEIVFQSVNEAFQMLADITGKKIIVPDKAEATIASQEDAEQIGDEISNEENNNSETAEDEGPLTPTIEKTEKGLDELKKINKDVQSAISKATNITG